MEQRLITNASLLHRRMREARRAARRGYEICGLLVSTDNYHLDLVPVRNTARRPGGFQIEPAWWHIARHGGGYHQRDVVGTYHSHPSWSAEPGESDVAGTWDKALMLVLACNRWDNVARLWRIRDDGALPVPLVLVA